MVEIEKGIPMPMGGRGVPTYPWRTMEVGDSFFVPGVRRRGFYVATSRAGKRTGRKFLTRTVDGGVRVWRVA